MLMPSIFRDDLFDDFFGVPFRGYKFDSGTHQMMRTDIKDLDSSYEVTMDLPGVKKEDVNAELKDGYLTINATSDTQKEERDEAGRYIRRERYSGTCSRSFYVGEQITQEDIKARFENGTLKLQIPKKEARPALEDKKYIAIEG